MIEIDNTLLVLTPRNIPTLTLDDTGSVPSLDDNDDTGGNNIPDVKDIESFDELMVKANPNFDPHDG